MSQNLPVEHRADINPVALLGVRLGTAPRANPLPGTSPEHVITFSSPSVLVFVIVSGLFVITHVILQKQESYWPYITRRFFRIFPLFAVTCVIGFFTSGLLAEALSNPDDFGFTQNVKDIAWRRPTCRCMRLRISS
jgi:peptidoglycan/LPS O-acetylase OafA/YrhL